MKDKREIRDNNFELNPHWSNLDLQPNRQYDVDRFSLAQSIREHCKNTSEEFTYEIVDFIENISSQACAVLALESSPFVRIVDLPSLFGKFKILGRNFHKATIRQGEIEYNTWVLDLTSADINNISEWHERGTKSDDHWKSYFQAKLARTIGHEAAHQKIAESNSSLANQSTLAAQEIQEIGNSTLYQNDHGEKLCGDFDKEFLVRLVRLWKSSQGSQNDTDFYDSPTGKNIIAWEQYLYNDYDRETV